MRSINGLGLGYVLDWRLVRLSVFLSKQRGRNTLMTLKIMKMLKMFKYSLQN